VVNQKHSNCPLTSIPYLGNVGFLSVESLDHVRVFSLRLRLQMKRTSSSL